MVLVPLQIKKLTIVSKIHETLCIQLVEFELYIVFIHIFVNIEIKHLVN